MECFLILIMKRILYRLFILHVLDSIWADWNQWGSCSAPCGGGTQTRTRTCDYQSNYGGKYCSGPTYEIATCNDDYCPGKKTLYYLFGVI